MSQDIMPIERFQKILGCLPDPLMILDSTLQVNYVNSALEKMLGVSWRQIKGISIHESGLGKGSDWKILMQTLKQFLNGNSGEGQDSSQKNSKSKKPIKDPLKPKGLLDPFHSKPKINLNNRIYFYEFFEVSAEEKSDSLTGVLFREITKDIEINDQIIQAEKMSGLGTLAAGLAHELNNPLYTLIGFSEMILKEHDKAKIDLIARGIGERSKELVGILARLNSYIQSNPIEGHNTVNLNERLDVALEIALLAQESKNVTIEKNYSPLPFLKAKADEIQQIFFNVITNSLQAMNGEGSLQLDSARNDNEIVVTIRDTGEGVPKEYIAKVFDPFFTTKDQGEGTGLGLTATYQLVKKYGGRIKFNSVQGEGTTVEIVWPVKNGCAL